MMTNVWYPHRGLQVAVATDCESRINHAGVYVGNNEPPEVDEVSRWLAAEKEVVGFQWQDKPDADDPDPPKYSVTGIRRSMGTLYGVVRTDQLDRQEDHLLSEIREKVFYNRVEYGLRTIPLMVQWRSFAEANLFIDHNLVRANAEFYQDIVR